MNPLEAAIEITKLFSSASRVQEKTLKFCIITSMFTIFKYFVI